MTKFKTTQKVIKANYSTIISTPYCSLQNLLCYEAPVAYTVRREGWAADVYDMGGGVAIVTGYAPFGNIRPSYQLLRRYETGAEKIRERCGFDYEKCKAGFRAAIRELVEEAVRA